MKKKWLQKIISAGLALSMLVGLTGCGGNAKNDPNAALAKEYVYAEQTLEMPDLGNDISIRMVSNQQDRVYALVQVYNWSETDGEENKMKILSWKKDGTDLQVADVQMSMNGEAPSADDASGENAVIEDAIVNDVMEEFPAEDIATEEKPVIEDVNDDMIMDDMAVVMPSGGYEYTGLNYGRIANDGMLYAIKEHNKEDYSNPEKPVYLNETSVCCWNLEGVMQWEVKLENLQTEDSWSYVQNLVPMKNGEITVLLGGDKCEKIVVKADGTVSPRQAIQNGSEILNNASDVFAREDGMLSVICWDATDGASMYLTTYDLEKDVVGEKTKLPDSFMMSGYSGVTTGAGADLIYCNNSGVFQYNVGEEHPTQIMSYINSDMNTSGMYNIAMVDDTRFIGFYHDNATGKMQGGVFTKVNPEDIKDKRVVVLAGNYVDYEIKERIVAFNKSNENYRIVIKEYEKYSTMEDYMAGYAQLNNDIISGGMPDILLADMNMQVENYASKGLIADVGALIAKDEELSQKEFMQNVFDAFKVNGKLYYVIPSFNVRTMIAKKSIVGDRNTWTMKDMQELVAKMPEGATGIGDMTRTSFFYTMLQYCGSDFIDVSTGKCNFESPDFINMLKYAAELPEEFNEDYWGEDYWMSYESQYRDNKTLAMQCYIGSARDMVRNINGSFGEEISYIGFPTESGKGSVITANQKFALSAKSKNLEGAWEFVRYYLTDEYQKKMEWALPVSKDAFMENAKAAMQNPYYLDENGEKVEYEDTFYFNNEEIPLENLSQEQVDQFVSFVESVDKQSYYNEAIQNIVLEESAAFFEGQKSAENVANIIQSRIQVYVNENR